MSSPSADDETLRRNASSAIATERTSLLNNTDRTHDPQEQDHHQHQQQEQRFSILRAAVCSVALGLLVFLQATNISLITTTQSAIAADLDAFENISWATSAFLIAMSALGPLNGKLSAAFTPRRVICTASVIMALGAVVCACAADWPAFLAGRIVSGIGASGIYTVSMIVVLEMAPIKHRAVAIAFLNTGLTIGVAVGAAAAGALRERLGWRMLFWLQVPLALAGGLGLAIALPASRNTITSNTSSSSPNSPVLSSPSKTPSQTTIWTKLRNIDYLGAIALTTSIVLFLYALSSPQTIPLLPILLSIFVLILFVLVELYVARDPIIPIILLRSRALLLSCLAILGFMAGRWSVFFFTPTYALAVRGWSPAAAGSVLIPTNIGFALGSLVVGALHIRHHGSYYIATLITYLLFPFTLLIMALLATHTSAPAAFIVALVASGALTGAILNYSLAHVLYLTPPHTHHVATALLSTFRGFSGSFGSAIGGGLFIRTLRESLISQFASHGLRRDDLVRRLLGAPELVAGLRGVEHDVAVTAYEVSLRRLWLLAAALAASVVLVQAGAGWKGYEAVPSQGADGNAPEEDSEDVEDDEEHAVRAAVSFPAGEQHRDER